jgi:hypothetical protein
MNLLCSGLETQHVAIDKILKAVKEIKKPIQKKLKNLYFFFRVFFKKSLTSSSTFFGL